MEKEKEQYGSGTSGTKRREKMRLQKYMAECGVASRRKAEEMIAQGRVTVNGVKITEMGTQVEEGCEVRVDGQVIRPEGEKRYVMYHKPAGEVTTAGRTLPAASIFL